jgi:hypothetical protein
MTIHSGSPGKPGKIEWHNETTDDEVKKWD